MGLTDDPAVGEIPLDEEELTGLIPSIVVTRRDLNEFEQEGTKGAIEWSLKKKFAQSEILTEDFVKMVHKKMFGEIWKWAGEFRKTDKNIGISWPMIPTSLHTLLSDCAYWIDNSTYPSDEIAIRFKHRLVQIHCFPNGNGRHSRLMGDIIIDHIFHGEVFTWGSKTNLTQSGEGRRQYISAVKAADGQNVNPLLEFARK